MSEVRFTRRPDDAASARSIAPYFPFPRVIPVRQHLTMTDGSVCQRVIAFDSHPRGAISSPRPAAA